MGEHSKIEWTQHTFNPWIGCSKVSPACDHCYAEAMAKRAGWDVWGDGKPRKTMRDAYWKQPYKWDREARDSGQRARVFCASMADVFEDRRELDALRDRLWTVIEETPGLDWLLLTKRPQNMVRLAPERWSKQWPANVWAGTTAEDQERADERIPWLQEVPSAVRFLSIEPMLGPVDLENVHPYYMKRDANPNDPVVRFDCLRGHMKGPDEMLPEQRVHWVIVGGESGPGARPFAVEWAVDVVRQCRDAGVPVFMKQYGDRPAFAGEPIKLRTRKGADLSELRGDWPREFPR